MKFYPTRPQGQFLCFILFSVILILSCSKDSDLFNEGLFDEASQSVEDREKTVTETTDEIEEEVSTTPEEEASVVAEDPVTPEETVENRTTIFIPIHDAHFQSGKSYNQHIVRLEEGSRTSYLMFDLSQIDSVGGQITEAKLQFTINSDGGDGTINVFKGQSTDWTENDLSNVPEAEVQLGSILKQYKIGSTEEIQLETEHLIAETSTLIMDHEDGNDLAFASKEHPSAEGPKLVVSYDAPEDAPEIMIAEEEEQNTQEEAEDQEEESTEEESTEEEVTVAENEVPVAVADGTPSSGTAPLKVKFKGSSSSDDSKISKFKWTFEDGKTSGSTNPEYTFDKPGEYEVKLEVTDEEGLTDTDTVTITVNAEDNEAPKAVVSAAPTSGEAPLKVEFKGSKSTDDNGIKSYVWEFKDGETATNANPEHTFEEAGEYNVKLTVEDENGLSSSKTIKITVEEPETNEAPKAIATATPKSGEAPLEVQFKGSNSTDDKEVEKYKWDFKDGSTSTSKNPSHTFKDSGSYKVDLTVKDEEGLSHSKTVTITVSEPVQNESPKAVATATPKSGEAPLEVQFKGSNSTDDDTIVGHSWDFKDGSNSSSKNPSHTFNNPGSYKVKLTVTDNDGLEHSDTITINVEEPVVVKPSPNADVRYWQNLFDSKWSSQNRQHALSLSKSKNKNQEYYNLGLYIDGLRNIWQATGDNKYLDTALSLINTTVDDARSVGGGFLGWRAADGDTKPLWDSFYWRQVATLLRIMHQSPNLKSSSKYKNQFNKLVAFSEKNIWDRYDNEGQSHNFYRSKTHMTSHWARIGLELYLITGKNKYKQVFNNISYGSMIGYPSNLRNQLFSNPKNSKAYAWDDEWGVRKGSNIQDVSHAGAIVGLIALAYDQGMYWKRSDINALLKTVDVVWTAPDVIKTNVDASGGNGSRGRLHEWFYMARYSQSLQNRIKRDYLSNPHMNYYGSQALGIAALNAKILADGKGVYPER